MSLNISLALFNVFLASFIITPKNFLNVLWSFPNIAQHPLVMSLVLLNILDMFLTSLVIAHDLFFDVLGVLSTLLNTPNLLFGVA